jgi:hypothetical protein
MRIYQNKMFFKWAMSEGITDNMLARASDEVEAGLIDATLGSGLIKKRIARRGQGKRSGFRTIIGFLKGHKYFFIYGFQKNQRDNISQEEEKILKKLAQKFLEASEIDLKKMIHNGDLYEVNYEKRKKS